MFFHIYFLQKEKSKRCEVNTEQSNPYGFELHRAAIKSTKLRFKIIKTVIIKEGQERENDEERNSGPGERFEKRKSQ